MGTQENQIKDTYQGIEYHIIQTDEKYPRIQYRMTCNGNDVTKEIAASNPDPLNPGEIDEFLDIKGADYAIKSSINSWLAASVTLTLTRLQHLRLTAFLIETRADLPEVGCDRQKG